MTAVVADISMSLDGFVTGPEPDMEHGLGRGGEALHTWAISSDDPVDLDVLRSATERSGAVIMGRRLFDYIDGPNGWDDEMGYGAGMAATPAFFVVTHTPPEEHRLALDFTFVPGGVADAVAQAREAAGTRDVVVMGGADVVRQAVDEGLVAELTIHLAPVLLGGGTPLFPAATHRTLMQKSVRVSRYATHVTYDLAP
jgi:dihydrofolate reductase